MKTASKPAARRPSVNRAFPSPSTPSRLDAPACGIGSCPSPVGADSRPESMCAILASANGARVVRSARFQRRACVARRTARILVRAVMRQADPWAAVAQQSQRPMCRRAGVPRYVSRRVGDEGVFECVAQLENGRRQVVQRRPRSPTLVGLRGGSPPRRRSTGPDGWRQPPQCGDDGRGGGEPAHLLDEHVAGGPGDLHRAPRRVDDNPVGPSGMGLESTR